MIGRMAADRKKMPGAAHILITGIPGSGRTDRFKKRCDMA
jgi:hypothetical protein